MPKRHKPRKGSLQYWPRKYARKVLPSVNWQFLQKKVAESEKGEKSDSKKKFLGLVCYKVGMLRVLARDLTQHSMTRNREVIIPATVVECPPFKIFSARFYKEGKVAAEVIVSGDKELKKKVLLPKQFKQDNAVKKLADFEKKLEEYDDIRLIVYPAIKKITLKKTPDLAEIGLSGSLQEEFEFTKNLIGKEIGVEDIFSAGSIVDIHGVTKGKGTSGPVKRYGIGLKVHKTEKGTRRPGSLGPWTPKRVAFSAPLAGQLGYLTRLNYNNKILGVMKPTDFDMKSGFNKYGVIKNTCLLVKGSLQGTQKRPLLLTVAARPSKKIKKQNFEILKVLG